MPEIGGAATDFHHLVHHTWRCAVHSCGCQLEFRTKIKMIRDRFIQDGLKDCKLAIPNKEHVVKVTFWGGSEVNVFSRWF